MASGGGDIVVPVSPRAQQTSRGGRRRRRHRHRQKAAGFPLDVIAEIAARSDPATLVRCASTCRDARRRIAGDPSLLGRLRLRATERFVLPLLRGHLTGMKTDVYMVDTTGAADATRLVKATFAEADTTVRSVVPLDSRGGLVLLRATTTMAENNTQQQKQLLVCNPATGRRLALPPEPAFPYAGWSADWSTCGVQYVLLVGGSGREGPSSNAAVGRPFQVLKAKLVLSVHRSYRRLLVHIFSSEHGAWSLLTEILTPEVHDSWSSRPLVVGDVVHWLFLANRATYMLELHVGAARVDVTSLPASFPHDDNRDYYDFRRRYLLATATAGGNPVVLVADEDKISAWEQSKHTRTGPSRENPRPCTKLKNEAY